LEEYIDPKVKFDTLNQYFGISACKLRPSAGNKKLQRMEVRELKEKGVLISGFWFSMKNVILALRKNPERRSEKDLNYILPLLSHS